MIQRARLAKSAVLALTLVVGAAALWPSAQADPPITNQAAVHYRDLYDNLYSTVSNVATVDFVRLTNTKSFLGTAVPGQTIDAEIVIRNRGSIDALITINDQLDSELEYVNSDPAGSYDPVTSTLTWTIPSLPPGEQISLRLTARVLARALAGASITNTSIATVLSRDFPSNTAEALVQPASQVDLQLVWTYEAGGPLTQEAAANVTAHVRRPGGPVLATLTTDAQGVVSESIAGLPRDETLLVRVFAPAERPSHVSAFQIDSTATGVILLPVHPAIGVLDAITGQPITGARARLVEAGSGATVSVSGLLPDGLTNLENPAWSGGGETAPAYGLLAGEVHFAGIPANDYRVLVELTGELAARYRPVEAAPGRWQGLDIPYRGEIFSVDALPVGMVIPLQPAATLELRKRADRPEAGPGELVTYALTLRNPGTSPTAAGAELTITDLLPGGLLYADGTARLANAPVETRRHGPNVTFVLAQLGPGQTHTLTYQALVTALAVPGRVQINRAVAQVNGVEASNLAQAALRVTPGVARAGGILVGKVFHDRDADGVQDPDEPGLAGVAIYLADGTRVITDAAGQFHVPGLSAGTMTLKLDLRSLPEGARVNGELSRFVTIPAGGLAREVFAVILPEEHP
jgi:uncharacterized repeat protein (TIGR01451 family)